MWNRFILYFKILAVGLRCLAERLTNPGSAYWIFTPEHDNIGDHAIAEAEKEFFEQNGIKVIEVSGAELQRRRELGGLIRLMNGRPILVHGGGFLGTLWFPCELLLRDVIQMNPRSPIILLPNTVYYDDSPKDRIELDNSIRIYNAHPDLRIYIREGISYAQAKECYRNVKLMPDMVMYLNRCEQSENRNGGILCLRTDHEKTRTEKEEHTIIQQMTQIFGERITSRDMVVDYNIPSKDRSREVERQLDAFRHAELVVTDRLHGMVFCAITGTPCIVLNSKSPKVKGCYEWISHLPYIRFCDDPETIAEIYAAMPKNNLTYDNSGLMPYFRSLADDIKTMLRKR